MWLFKKKEKLSKEEISLKLKEQCDLLNQKYKEYFNNICKIDHLIFIFEKFSIRDNEIHLDFTQHNTIKDLISTISLWKWEFRYGNCNIEKYRINWLKFKGELESLGLEIKIKSKL